jgi:hypothetical protein
MIVAAVLRLAVDCPECKLAVPVNRIVPAARCYHCGGRFDLRWNKLLDLGNPKIHALDRAVALKPGRSDRGAFSTIHLDVTRAEPECRACRGVLPSADLIAGVGSGRDAHCPHCAVVVPMRPAPPELTATYAAARPPRRANR